MKSLLVVVAIFAVAQAHHGLGDHALITPVTRTFPEVAGAPQYPKPRIINGNQASRGQLPYQVGLFLDGRGFCGGSLISRRWVLTAAHCASGITTFSVNLGAQAINSASEAGRVTIETRTSVVHPNYISLIAANDVALLDLGQDVQLSDYIQTIPIASGSNLYVGNSARVSGWGKVSDATNSISPQLNFVDVNVIENTVCAQTYGTLVIRSSTICTLGSSGRATCNGDSGGPLVDEASGRQIGVVSFGSSAGCESGAPNGFGRVTAFADWISSVTGIKI